MFFRMPTDPKHRIFARPFHSHRLISPTRNSLSLTLWRGTSSSYVPCILCALTIDTPHIVTTLSWKLFLHTGVSSYTPLYTSSPTSFRTNNISLFLSHYTHFFNTQTTNAVHTDNETTGPRRYVCYHCLCVYCCPLHQGILSEGVGAAVLGLYYYFIGVILPNVALANCLDI